MTSIQTLTLAQRRVVTAWAADCAEHVYPLFAAESDDTVVWDAIERTRAFSRGELDTAEEIRRRFVAFRATGLTEASTAAARSASQAAAVAHMGAHALGAAGYAVKARVRAGAQPEAFDDE